MNPLNITTERDWIENHYREETSNKVSLERKQNGLRINCVKKNGVKSLLYRPDKIIDPTSTMLRVRQIPF